MRYAPWFVAVARDRSWAGSSIPAATSSTRRVCWPPPSRCNATSIRPPTIERGGLSPAPARGIQRHGARAARARTIPWAQLADLVPTDFAVGWGPMSDSAVLEDVEITQVEPVLLLAHRKLADRARRNREPFGQLARDPGQSRGARGARPAASGQHRRAGRRAGRHRRWEWRHAHLAHAPRHRRRRLRGTVGRSRRRIIEPG